MTPSRPVTMPGGSAAPSTLSQSPVDPAEKRTFPRTSVSERFTVRADGRTALMEARDISLGGIFLYTDDEALGLSTRIEVDIPVLEGEPALALGGEVVRVLPLPADAAQTLGVGVRWNDPTPEQKAQLARAIDRLMASHAGQRNHPRLTALLSVTYPPNRQAEMVLENLSTGGMGLLVDTEVVLGEQVEVELQVFGQEPLRLAGAVVRSEETERVKVFRRIGVQFGPLPVETRQALQQMLKRLIR